MADILEQLKRFTCFNAGVSASTEKITLAENELGVCFSEEYKEYLKGYGIASVYGHELTGIFDSKRLNVVDVTFSERQYNDNIPKDWYVLEQAHIDDIVIWQNEKGEIFQTCPGNQPLKIADSIIEYLSLDEE